MVRKAEQESEANICWAFPNKMRKKKGEDIRKKKSNKIKTLITIYKIRTLPKNLKILDRWTSELLAWFKFTCNMNKTIFIYPKFHAITSDLERSRTAVSDNESTSSTKCMSSAMNPKTRSFIFKIRSSFVLIMWRNHKWLTSRRRTWAPLLATCLLLQWASLPELQFRYSN